MLEDPSGSAVSNAPRGKCKMLMRKHSMPHGSASIPRPSPQEKKTTTKLKLNSNRSAEAPRLDVSPCGMLSEPLVGDISHAQVCLLISRPCSSQYCNSMDHRVKSVSENAKLHLYIKSRYHSHLPSSTSITSMSACDQLPKSFRLTFSTHFTKCHQCNVAKRHKREA